MERHGDFGTIDCFRFDLPLLPIFKSLTELTFGVEQPKLTSP